MASVLTKKQRALPDGAKVQTLVRIGKRAMARAAWYRELADQQEATLSMPGFYDSDLDRAAAVKRIRELRADAPKYDERARLAADEALAVASASDSLDLRRKARLAGAL